MMPREIAVLVPETHFPAHRQAKVYVVNAPNGATAKGEVSSATGVPKHELDFVQIERIDRYGDRS